MQPDLTHRKAQMERLDRLARRLAKESGTCVEGRSNSLRLPRPVPVGGWCDTGFARRVASKNFPRGTRKRRIGL